MRRSLLIIGLISSLAISATRPLQQTILDPQWWGSLGVGGLMASLVLFWKRSDDKSYAESLKANADTLKSRDDAHAAALVAANKQYIDALERQAAQMADQNKCVLEVVVSNTKIVTELVSAINNQAQQRRRDDPPRSAESAA